MMLLMQKFLKTLYVTCPKQQNMQLKMIIKFNKCCINAVYLHAIICTFTNRNTTTRLVDYAQNLACVMCKKNEH